MSEEQRQRKKEGDREQQRVMMRNATESGTETKTRKTKEQ